MITLPWPPAILSPNNQTAKRWTGEDDALLSDMWESGCTRGEIGSVLGRSIGSVANRAYRLRISSPREWSEDDLADLRDCYQSARTSEDLRLRELAARLGRTYNSVVVKAGRLGLTDIKRLGVNVRADAPKYPDEQSRRKGMSEMAKLRIARDGHPRHMLGKSHTRETRQIISDKGKAWHAHQTPEQVSSRVERARKTSIANGTTNVGRARGNWKAGWREIGDQRNYYRSRWEANYARYLEWLRSNGEIAAWRHEPETFWFDGIKRGVRSYLPDFRVWDNDGSSKLHEVKGWMDARSKTTLRRMAKYHPSETIIVIREKQYNEIARKVGPMIHDWESGGRPDRP